MDREWTAFRFRGFFVRCCAPKWIEGWVTGRKWDFLPHPFRLWHFFRLLLINSSLHWGALYFGRCGGVEALDFNAFWPYCLYRPLGSCLWETTNYLRKQVQRWHGYEEYKVLQEDISARLLDLEMRGAGGRTSMSYYEYNKLSGIYCIKINRFERIKYLHSVFIWKHTCMKIHVLKLPFSFLCLSWPCIIIFPFMFPSIKFPTKAGELSSIAQRAQQSKQALAVWASWFWKLQHPIWHPSGMPGVAWWAWMLCTWIIGS